MSVLKFALLGEVVGLIVMFGIATIYKSEMHKWNEPEAILTIPFYLMLLGLIIGTIVTFKNKRKAAKV